MGGGSRALSKKKIGKSPQNRPILGSTDILGSIRGVFCLYIHYSTDLQMRHQKLFTLARHLSVGHFE